MGPFSRGIGKSCHDADAVLVYSEATKRDIVRHLDVEVDKITIAPMAVDAQFAPLPREEAVRIADERYGVRGPFVLFVSTLEPRKNVVGLLKSFALLADRFPHNLVLVGPVGWNAEAIFTTLRELGIEERVVRPGYVPHLDLPVFYCAADAFVFPTHYEGFGLPLLEALVCGCPVVSSENSSVPEVTGDGALRCDSEDFEGFAALVERVLTDPSLREGLVRRGKAHAAQFSWEACARTTMNVYKKLAAC